ncbi:putative F-box LRR-repeat protein [Clavispora lusitaniae]|uniref:F-box LRR-repeat protein n=1 Tax=Clavispora lusitaniae TaxID=36911 RepID=A0ACD0WEF8_CLALS|nr:putative F-box LRR-repeat protein [Clavispora lusitaniae]QFZ31053.1 putative F-box LRR-repeat protein [Clavispora lusitaniae]QFZ36721.1 putative F-box LRR-repeat protein [Clavispora lusitaniae]QFZ42405.1 putative F-box LRR-repeat protein [Clavispora lusitaniae]QFZ48081.1 putative F-box LRR-repeat protein [Clavispora lusitaniae]
MNSPARKFKPSSPSPLATTQEAQRHGAVHQQPVSPSPSPSLSEEFYDYSGPLEETDNDHDSFAQKSIPQTLLDKLVTFPLFKDAPKSFHTKVGAKLKLVQYHPQEYIIKEGDPAMSMYWILKGTVSVTSTDGESVYAELAPGAFFGEIGILFNRPRTATVVARQRVLVGVLTADALNVVLRSYPLIERRIRDEAQERLAMHEKKNKAEMPILKPSKSPAPNSGAHFHSSHAPASPGSLEPSPLSQIVNASQKASSPLDAVSADNVDQTVSIQDFIKSVPIFKNLPSHIIHKVALDVEPLNFTPFEYIVRKGDLGSDIYFVTNGEVEVVDYRGENKNMEQVLARLKWGSYFGEMSFLEYLQGNENVPRSATIRSVTSVELIVIRSDQLKSICAQYPTIADQIRHTANERKNSNQTAQSPNPSVLSLGFNTQSFSTRRFSSPSISSLSAESADAPVASIVSTSDGEEVKRPLVAPKPTLFNPNWGFFNAGDSRVPVSKSVSPVSFSDQDLPFTKPILTKHSSDDAVRLRKRKSFSGAVSPSQRLPEGPLDISLPPMNPSDTLNTFLPPGRKQPFQYMPHCKRVKLANLAGRRRSSVLVSTGSIPDKILLKVFEYLSLPELMKLRAISRRWRQLLYVAPNLFKRLDLTPWNTSVDDDALISITDFVGSRPEYIDISNCFHITDEGFSYMVNEIGMSGKIKVLKMRSIWEVSAMAIMDLTSPSVGRYLEEVDFSNCRKVNDNVIERLIGWVNDDQLQATNVESGYHHGDTGSKNLKVLNLGYCKHLTDNIMYHISMHANLRLESLDLTRCTTITDAGFQYWTYRNFPNLKKLSLKDCTFLTEKAVISLANAAPNLEILDLNFCCALSDIAIEVLCLGCHKIRELDLSFCGSAVSDSSLYAISLHLNNLEKLVVKGCVRVTRAGVDALLSGYSPLTYINISQCRNAHIYPGGIPAQTFQVNPETKSAFVSAGPVQKVIEIVL